jgi:hypothetical protein
MQHAAHSHCHLSLVIDQALGNGIENSKKTAVAFQASRIVRKTTCQDGYE